MTQSNSVKLGLGGNLSLISNINLDSSNIQVDSYVLTKDNLGTLTKPNVCLSFVRPVLSETNYKKGYIGHITYSSKPIAATQYYKAIDKFFLTRRGELENFNIGKIRRDFLDAKFFSKILKHEFDNKNTNPLYSYNRFAFPKRLKGVYTTNILSTYQSPVNLANNSITNSLKQNNNFKYVPGGWDSKKGIYMPVNAYAPYPQSCFVYKYPKFNYPVKIVPYTPNDAGTMDGLLVISTGNNTNQNIVYVSPHNASARTFNTVVENIKTVKSVQQKDVENIVTQKLLDADYASGKWIAVGQNNYNNPTADITISTNSGITWQTVTNALPITGLWSSIAQGTGRWITVPTYYRESKGATSTNTGVTWSLINLSGTNNGAYTPMEYFNKIVFNGTNRWVAVGASRVTGTTTGLARDLSKAKTTMAKWNYGATLDNLSLLLHMSGTNGSTTFIDNSSYKFLVTPHGNVNIKSGQKKFGTSSAYFDGDGDYLSISDDKAFGFGREDFTIECWVYPTQLADENDLTAIIDLRNAGGSNGVGLFITSNTSEVMFYDGSRNGTIDSNRTIPLNQWTHIAVQRRASNWEIYINGTLSNKNTYYNNGDVLSSRPCYIGTAADSPGFYRNFKGYIDEVRISNTSRYTSNFQPQTVEFLNSDAINLSRYGLLGDFNDVPFYYVNDYLYQGLGQYSKLYIQDKNNFTPTGNPINLTFVRLPNEPGVSSDSSVPLRTTGWTQSDPNLATYFGNNIPTGELGFKLPAVFTGFAGPNRHALKLSSGSYIDIFHDMGADIVRGFGVGWFASNSPNGPWESFLLGDQPSNFIKKFGLGSAQGYLPKTADHLLLVMENSGFAYRAHEPFLEITARLGTSNSSTWIFKSGSNSYISGNLGLPYRATGNLSKNSTIINGIKSESACCSGGYYIATGSVTGYAPRTITSTDGTTWSGNNFIPFNNGIILPVYGTSNIATTYFNTTLAYGGGKWVTFSNQNPTASGSHSANGINWTGFAFNTITTGSISYLEYGNGKFIAVPSSGSRFATSSNGNTWSALNVPLNANWGGISYNGKEWTVIPSTSSSSLSGLKSANGTNWTGFLLHTAQDSKAWNNIFSITGVSGISNDIMIGNGYVRKLEILKNEYIKIASGLRVRGVYLGSSSPVFTNGLVKLSHNEKVGLLSQLVSGIASTNDLLKQGIIIDTGANFNQVTSLISDYYNLSGSGLLETYYGSTETADETLSFLTGLKDYYQNYSGCTNFNTSDPLSCIYSGNPDNQIDLTSAIPYTEYKVKNHLQQTTPLYNTHFYDLYNTLYSQDNGHKILSTGTWDGIVPSGVNLYIEYISTDGGNVGTDTEFLITYTGYGINDEVDISLRMQSADRVKSKGFTSFSYESIYNASWENSLKFQKWKRNEYLWNTEWSSYNPSNSQLRSWHFINNTGDKFSDLNISPEPDTPFKPADKYVPPRPYSWNPSTSSSMNLEQHLENLNQENK